MYSTLLWKEQSFFVHQPRQPENPHLSGKHETTLLQIQIWEKQRNSNWDFICKNLAKPNTQALLQIRISDVARQHCRLRICSFFWFEKYIWDEQICLDVADQSESWTVWAPLSWGWSWVKKTQKWKCAVPPSERAPEGESINNSSPSLFKNRKRLKMQSLGSDTGVQGYENYP